MQTSLDLRQLTDVSNSTVFGSDLKAPPTATSYKATARPVDLQHVPPQVISLFLDLVVHDDNRLSTITKAEQYLQIRAFAQRYAIPRLFTCLQGVRDKVKENDPFGFMKVLTDEAVSQYQAREIESRVESLIFKLQNQSGDDVQLIADSTWDTTNKALTSLNLSISRSRSKAPTISRGGRLSSDAQSMISEGVSEVLAEVQKLFDTREGQEKARNRVYHSEEMKESILALHNHFYITSENHFPARWSSYGDTTYSNNVVESDTPAHALPTQVAQALGIPFYRAFTFSLNDALIQQDFRSGYTRAPQDPPPFHQQDRPSTEQPREADGSTIRLSLEPAGGHTSHPGPAAYPVEPSSPIVHGSSNQERDDTANSCAAPYQIHMDDDHRNPEEQNATVQRPPSPSTFKSPPNPLDNLPSVSKTQFSAPPSITDTHLIQPSMTQTQRKLGRKSTMDEVKRENENDTPSAFDRRDDQFDEGKQLWLDIWRGIVEYLPDGERFPKQPYHVP